MTSDVQINDATEAITQRFIANWDAVSTPFTLDNENFTAPDSTPWIRMTIRFTVAGQYTLGQPGNRKWQRKGLIIGNIFVPANGGRQKADQLAQTFKDIFEGNHFGPIEAYDANVKELGTDGLWFQVAVQVDFNYNELK
jgi:hypothetical protein